LEKELLSLGFLSKKGYFEPGSPRRARLSRPVQSPGAFS